jgi:hypothetical protein
MLFHLILPFHVCRSILGLKYYTTRLSTLWMGCAGILTQMLSSIFRQNLLAKIFWLGFKLAWCILKCIAQWFFQCSSSRKHMRNFCGYFSKWGDWVEILHINVHCSQLVVQGPVVLPSENLRPQLAAVREPAQCSNIRVEDIALHIGLHFQFGASQCSV